MGAKIINFSVQQFPGARVIGRTVRTKDKVDIDDVTITDVLDAMRRDGSNDRLFALPGRLTEAKDTVGWMGDWKPGDEFFTYLAGVLFQPGTPIPEGFEARDIVPCQVAVGWITETEGGDMFGNASGLLGEAKKAHGYEYDGDAGMFEMEYYSDERFNAPIARGEPPVLDFYSPCKKVG